MTCTQKIIKRRDNRESDKQCNRSLIAALDAVKIFFFVWMLHTILFSHVLVGARHRGLPCNQCSTPESHHFFSPVDWQDQASASIVYLVATTGSSNSESMLEFRYSLTVSAQRHRDVAFLSSERDLAPSQRRGLRPVWSCKPRTKTVIRGYV